MKKRVFAALCACLLAVSCVLSIFGSARASRTDVYFTVVNDKVLELRSDTMPFFSGGELYVPYTVFDPNSTEISLGVFATYVNNTVMLYSRSTNALVFDLSADTAMSTGGRTFSKTAIRRNSVVFLPVDLVCNYFGLKWSWWINPDYGFAVRVKSASARLSDQDIIPAARNIMESRYNAYMKSITPPEETDPPAASPSPEPAPSQSPHPVQPVQPVDQTPAPTQPQTPQPQQPQQPQQPGPADPTPTTEVEPDPPQGGDVYLAFRCDQGGDTGALAAALERRELFGTFFFRPEELADRDDEVRALAAAGHKIGLLLDGAQEEDREEQARAGSELLAHILRAGADVALTEDAAVPEGWFRWTTTVDGRPGESGTTARWMRELIRAAAEPEECFLLLDDSSRCGELLERLLDGLEDEGCTFRLAVETALTQ